MGTACHWLFANALHGDACAGWMLYLHYPHQHYHRCRLQRMDPTIQACPFNCCHMHKFFQNFANVALRLDAVAHAAAQRTCIIITSIVLNLIPCEGTAHFFGVCNDSQVLSQFLV